MVLVGRTDTLLNIAKADSSKTGKQLVSLLLMVDEAFNPYNTDKDKLIKLQTKLKKNAFALIKKHSYREAAAVFLLCPTITMIKSSSGVLSQQYRSPFLSHLVMRLMETRLSTITGPSSSSAKNDHFSQNHNNFHDLSQSSTSSSSSNYLSSIYSSVNDTIADNTQPLLDRSTYVLGIFSSDIIKKDLLPGLLTAAKNTIPITNLKDGNAKKLSFPFDNKASSLSTLLDEQNNNNSNNTSINLENIGFHGIKDFSSILFAIICSLWLQEEELLLSTFHIVFPLLKQYIQNISTSFSSSPSTTTSSPIASTIISSERWEMLLSYKHSFHHKYRISHLYLIFSFLESTFTSSLYLPNTLIRLVSSFSFLIDSSYWITSSSSSSSSSKEFTGKLFLLILEFFEIYHLSFEQLQLTSIFQEILNKMSSSSSSSSSSSTSSTTKKKSKSPLHSNAFYKYAKQHYQKAISHLNPSSANDAKFSSPAKTGSINVPESSKATEVPVENKMKFNFSSFSSTKPSTAVVIPVSTVVGKSLLDNDFPIPVNRSTVNTTVPKDTLSNPPPVAKSALDIFDVMPSQPPRRTVPRQQPIESTPASVGNDPFQMQGKSALDSFDFAPTRPVSRPVAAEKTIDTKQANPSNLNGSVVVSSQENPSEKESIPKIIQSEEVKGSDLDVFDTANVKRTTSSNTDTPASQSTNFTADLKEEIPVVSLSTEDTKLSNHEELKPKDTQKFKSEGAMKNQEEAKPLKTDEEPPKSALKVPFPSQNKGHSTISGPQQGKGPVKSFEQRISAFYQKYNPTKISSIPSILEKYKGKEQELLDKLQKQYNAPYI
jgi:hypothetical protein